MGLNAVQDPELTELAQDVAPEKVLDTIEVRQQQIDDAPRTEKR